MMLHASLTQETRFTKALFRVPLELPRYLVYDWSKLFVGRG
jgi:hypothetical protein